MTVMRALIDHSYPILRNYMFDKDPEIAHDQFTHMMKKRASFLESILKLPQKKEPILPISNAAGFNKNGDMPLEVLSSLGFSRYVIGTITKQPREGNKKPRVWDFGDSFVNNLGFPNVGSRLIAKNLENYRSSEYPLTLNLSPSPGVSRREKPYDLESALEDLEGIGDRLELNISCPNNIDATIEELTFDLSIYLQMISMTDKSRETYIKLSPDMTNADIQSILSTCSQYDHVKGFVMGNTTSKHDARYITKPLSRGGASGHATYKKSHGAQKRLRKIIDTDEFKDKDWKLIACGGIDSYPKAFEAMMVGCDEIQLYSGLVSKGPKVISELYEGLQPII